MITSFSLNKNEKLNLSKKLKEEAIKPIESWTTHGLPNVIRSKHIFVKIIWVILFLGALGVSIYFLYKTLSDYLEFKVTTEVRSINVDELDFPVITICNSNMISNENGLEYFKLFLNESSKMSYDQLLDILNNETNNFNYYMNYSQQLLPYEFFYKIPIEKRQNYSVGIDQMFINGYLNDDYIYSTDFVWIFNPYIGSCYQLNTDSKLKAKAYNENILNLNFVFNLPDIVERFGLKKSLNLLISSKNSNPFVLLKVIDISTGARNFIQINKSVFSKKEKPFSNCDLVEDDNGDLNFPSNYDPKYFNQIKNAGYSYSQSLCISFCQLDKIGNNCSLRISSVNAPNNMNNFCPNQNLNVYENIELLDEMFYKYFYDKDIDKICSQLCPLECKTEYYQLYSTTSELKLNRFDYDSEDYIELYMTYSSLSYLNYQETPTVTIYNLVSNIGGVMGLLLGKIFTK
jgi:hypothetical protein